MQNRNVVIVQAYFNRVLGLHSSVDFRGVLYVPDEYLSEPARPEHVAVAVGYNSFIGRTCCMHTVIARPEAVTRRMVRETFEYPFVTCECAAVLALVDSTNAAALKFNLKLGFREIARIPNGGAEADLIVLQMLRSDCRWLKRATH